MNNFETDKKKKFLFLLVAIIVLIGAIFVILKNKKIPPVFVNEPKKEKTAGEFAKEALVPVEMDKNSAPVIGETVKEALAPVETNSTPAPVERDTAKEALAPVKIKK